jgi:uncharacterized circularly permuted ATP-grasp superfamily protein
MISGAVFYLCQLFRVDREFPIKKCMFRTFHFSLSLVALIGWSSAWANEMVQAPSPAQSPGLYYDEVFLPNGELRPQYKDIFPVFSQRSSEELSRIRRETLKDFRGDNALSALPRVITEEEFQNIQRGVAQRGEALLRFLQDHYSGTKSYERAGIIPPSVLRSIIDRSGESGFAGQIRPDLIRFMYGPDIIRDREGVFRVLEDNTSFLGGQGDLVLARESLFRHMPEYRGLLEGQHTADPRDYYRNLLARYRSEMPNPNEKIVVFAVPPYPDKEDFRLREIWRELGVSWVTPGSNPGLVKKADGLYLRSQVGGRTREEKVGYVVFNSEYPYADTSHPAVREQWLLKEASEQLSATGRAALPASVRVGLERALRPVGAQGRPDYRKIENILRTNSPIDFEMGKRTVPGLVDAILQGQVLTNNSPGSEFINDKEFNLYVEDLIRHYMRQEPILRNLPTRRLYRTDAGGRRILDAAVLRDLEQDMDKFVVKVVDGRGGEGVWVGPRLSPQERTALLQRLKTDTSREIIVQQYAHPSVLNGDIVDLRVLSQVGYGRTPNATHPTVYVPSLGWARGVSMAGDGKVNLSAGTAHEVTVIVRRMPEENAVTPAIRSMGSPMECEDVFGAFKPAVVNP